MLNETFSVIYKNVPWKDVKRLRESTKIFAIHFLHYINLVRLLKLISVIKTGCFDVENGPFFRRALMVAACFGNYKLSAQVVEHIWKTLLEKCRQARRVVERRDFGRKQQQQIANKTNGKSFRNSIQYQSCQFSNTHNTTAQNDNKTLKATNFYSLVMAHTVFFDTKEWFQTGCTWINSTLSCFGRK